ncbi:MAG: glycosyl hydrolase, partial [Alistipes sp.]
MKLHLLVLAVLLAACSSAKDSTPAAPTPPPPTPAVGGFDASKFDLAPTLCTPNASREAQNVYVFLKETFGKKIISGAMSKVSWNRDEVDWMHRKTGKYPALWCVDYIHLSWGEPDWTGYADLDMAQQWWDQHGLMAASWHWNVPKKEGDTQPADKAF